MGAMLWKYHAKPEPAEEAGLVEAVEEPTGTTETTADGQTVAGAEVTEADSAALEIQAADAGEVPEFEPGTLAATGQTEEETSAANDTADANDLAEQAEAANAEPGGSESVHQAVEAAGGQEVPVKDWTAAAHELGLTRGSSTADWAAFDAKTGATGLTKRDELAEHYLGAK